MDVKDEAIFTAAGINDRSVLAVFSISVCLAGGTTAADPLTVHLVVGAVHSVTAVLLTTVPATTRACAGKKGSYRV